MMGKNHPLVQSRPLLSLACLAGSSQTGC
jgi:hypothetical protein